METDYGLGDYATPKIEVPTYEISNLNRVAPRIESGLTYDRLLNKIKEPVQKPVYTPKAEPVQVPVYTPKVEPVVVQPVVKKTVAAPVKAVKTTTHVTSTPVGSSYPVIDETIVDIKVLDTTETVEEVVAVPVQKEVVAPVAELVKPAAVVPEILEVAETVELVQPELEIAAPVEIEEVAEVKPAAKKFSFDFGADLDLDEADEGTFDLDLGLDAAKDVELGNDLELAIGVEALDDGLDEDLGLGFGFNFGPGVEEAANLKVNTQDVGKKNSFLSGAFEVATEKTQPTEFSFATKKKPAAFAFDEELFFGGALSTGAIED